MTTPMTDLLTPQALAEKMRDDKQLRDDVAWALVRNDHVYNKSPTFIDLSVEAKNSFRSDAQKAIEEISRWPTLAATIRALMAQGEADRNTCGVLSDKNSALRVELAKAQARIAEIEDGLRPFAGAARLLSPTQERTHSMTHAHTHHTHRHHQPNPQPSFSVTLNVNVPREYALTPTRQREIVTALRRHLLDLIPGSTPGDGDTWSGV